MCERVRARVPSKRLGLVLGAGRGHPESSPVCTRAQGLAQGDLLSASSS